MLMVLLHVTVHFDRILEATSFPLFCVSASVGCVHPSYTKARCEFMMLCILLMRNYELIKYTLY